MSLLAVFAPGPWEIGIICCVAVLLFGSRLPSVARSIGSAIPSFKKGLKEVKDEVDDVTAEINKPVA